MPNDDSGYDAMVTGLVHSICAGRRGIEINLTSEDIRSKSPEDRPCYSCRLDRSSVHLDMMVQMATAAIVNRMSVTLIGYGDDRDDSLEFFELRLVGEG